MFSAPFYFDSDISTEWAPDPGMFGPHFARINNESVADDINNGIIHKSVILDLRTDDLGMADSPSDATLITGIEVTPRTGGDYPFANYAFIHFDFYTGATYLGRISYDMFIDPPGPPTFWATLETRMLAVSLTKA